MSEQYKVVDGTILTIGNNVKIGYETVIGGIPLMCEKGTHDILYDGTRRVTIEDDVIIGNGVKIMGGYYRDTLIKRGAKIWDECVIGHDCEIGEQAILSTGVILNGEVHVGDWSFIGSGTVVKPQTVVGRFVHVGIGTIVLDDVPDSAQVVGKGPRVIRVNEWRPKNGVE